MTSGPAARPCWRVPWPTPGAAGRCSPAGPAARNPTPPTASKTPPPTPNASPPGGPPCPAATSRSPPALPGPTCSTSTSAPAAAGTRPSTGSSAPGCSQGAVAAVVTPSGGMHLYYSGTGQASGRLPDCHLDFKATGGYVLAPPSAVGGRSYRLIQHQPGRMGQTAGGRLDWAAAVALLEPRQPHPQPARPPGHADTGRLAAWVARLPEGNRNAGLFWAACRAAETGHPGALDALAEAAQTAGLPEQEIARTIASARRSAGRERPARSRRHHAEPRAEHDSEAVI